MTPLKMRVARVALAGLCLLMLGAGIVAVRHWLKPADPAKRPEQSQGPGLAGPDLLYLPAETVQALAVKTVAAVAAPALDDLPALPGSLALDANRLSLINSRFTGEVVEVGTFRNEKRVTSQEGRAVAHSASAEVSEEPRPLRFGDRVEAGQLLAVVWCKDLGEKKSDLMDALIQEDLARKNVARIADLYKQGAVGKAAYEEAASTLHNKGNAANRAEATLLAWRLSAAEVAAVRTEADALIAGNRRLAFDARWARVEVRAALGGTILEKNVNVGSIVDTATILFKVADLSRLTVWAHVYEEDLPALQRLPKPIPWTVQLRTDPGAAVVEGTIDVIGHLIDPVQHTALVMGSVPNPDGRLRPGQFVTAIVKAPFANRGLP